MSYSIPKKLFLFLIKVYEFKQALCVNTVSAASIIIYC